MNRQGTEAMGSKARGEMSAKPLEAPNMYRCLKQQVQHLKVKKRSMATVSIHGANSNGSSARRLVGARLPRPTCTWLMPAFRSEEAPGFPAGVHGRARGKHSTSHLTLFNSFKQTKPPSYSRIRAFKEEQDLGEIIKLEIKYMD